MWHRIDKDSFICILQSIINCFKDTYQYVHVMDEVGWTTCQYKQNFVVRTIPIKKVIVIHNDSRRKLRCIDSDRR